MKGLALFAFCLSLSLLACSGRQSQPVASARPEAQQVPPVSFSADSAFEYLERQVEFGPRIPGSKAHADCLDYMVEVLSRFGATVFIQEGVGLAYDGKEEPVRNVIASFFPEKADRVLLAAHWDCRPFADHDPDPAKQNLPVDGANDGASGVAVLMEVGRQLAIKPSNVGVDIVLFDCEDGGTPDHIKVEYRPDTWCVGSQLWVKSDLGRNAQHRFGILLDMIGAPDAVFPVELYSKANCPDIVEKVWKMADRIGYGGLFTNDDGGFITDDHYYVNKFTSVPMVDIIHYDRASPNGFCKAWHTHADNPSNISKKSLAAVGEVVLSVIYAEH